MNVIERFCEEQARVPLVRPLQLYAQMEAGFMNVTCVTLGGDTLAQFVRLDPNLLGKDPSVWVHCLDPQWKPILPSGKVLEGPARWQPLRQLFKDARRVGRDDAILPAIAKDAAKGAT